MSGLYGAHSTFLALSTCDMYNSPVHIVVAINSLAASMDPPDYRSRDLSLASSNINISSYSPQLLMFCCISVVPKVEGRRVRSGASLVLKQPHSWRSLRRIFRMCSFSRSSAESRYLMCHVAMTPPCLSSKDELV